MTESERKVVDKLVHEGHDTSGRRRGKIMAVIATLALLFGVVWGAVAYVKVSGQAENGAQLAQDITNACDRTNTTTQLASFCPKAKQVLKQGPIGSPGATGPKGDTGPEGPQGETGASGTNGADGQPGKNGANGLNGAPGAKGDTGSVGGSGGSGTTGPKGDPGPKGEAGDIGPKGDTGPVGAQGPTGDSGVANVTTVGCDGPLITSVHSDYDATTKTIIITCNEELTP